MAQFCAAGPLYASVILTDSEESLAILPWRAPQKGNSQRFIAFAQNDRPGRKAGLRPAFAPSPLSPCKVGMGEIAFLCCMGWLDGCTKRLSGCTLLFLACTMRLTGCTTYLALCTEGFAGCTGRFSRCTVRRAGCTGGFGGLHDAFDALHDAGGWLHERGCFPDEPGAPGAGWTAVNVWTSAV